MNQYNSYYLYQQFEKRGSQDWLPCYPNIFSVDGDGTMPLVMKKENDPDCGYTGDTEPIYRWYPLPITTDYICDECPVVQYRWENMNPSTDYYCDGTTKYYKQKRQYSYDSGTTWYDVTPPEYQYGSVYEQQSTDCGYVPPIEPQYRTTSGTPYCEGVDKYVDVYSQVSYDGGSTWSTTATTPTLVEAQSVDCGYIPPGNKFVATYSNSTSYSAVCDGNTTLTTGNTRPTGYTLSAMTSAEIGDCVTSIGNSAFDDCYSLTSIDIPNSVTGIGDYAFRYCISLTSITIPSGVTSIGYRAFYYCRALTSVTIPDSVTSIGSGAFYECISLTSCTLGDNVTNIGSNAFSGCTSLISIVIPDSVANIGNDAFSYCSGLTSCTIGDSVANIGEKAFQWCMGLTSVTIPDSVTSIGKWAFYGCSSLTGITVEATTPPTLGSNVFYGTNNCPIYVPSGSVNAYKSASGWSTYSSRIQAIP